MTAAPPAGPTPGTPAAAGAVRFAIPGSHPALAGHFPGRPLVPAVVILDAVLEAAALGPTPVAGILHAKFSGALRPEQTCVVSFEPSPRGLRFLCREGDRVIASGLLATEPAPA